MYVCRLFRSSEHGSVRPVKSLRVNTLYLFKWGTKCQPQKFSRQGLVSDYAFCSPSSAVVTYSDETIIKHPFLNIDDVALAFNQLLHM